MVFCFENCSDLLWEKIALVIEKNFCKFDYECLYFIPTVKSQHKFWNKICAFLKLKYYEKATKLLSNVKTSWRYSQIFVVFSENLNFNLLFNGGSNQI